MSARRLVHLGLLASLAFLLMYLVQVPILPQAPYLTWDPSDAVALVAAIAFGPAGGLWVQAIKDLLFQLLRGPNPFGPLADFIAGGTFVVVAGAIARRRPRGARLAFALACGAVARALIMVPGNLAILPLQFGLSPHQVLAMQLPLLVPFNLIKSGINGALLWGVLAVLGRRLPLLGRAGGG